MEADRSGRALGADHNRLRAPLLLLLLVHITTTMRVQLSCGSQLKEYGSTAEKIVADIRTYHATRTNFCEEPTTPQKVWLMCNKTCMEACKAKLEEFLSNKSRLILTDAEPLTTLKNVVFMNSTQLDRLKDSSLQNCKFEMLSGDDAGADVDNTDALRSFSKTSVLFVSISFIILMVISLAWLVFYYVQRFRYAHAKDRLQRRLFNAARKALTRIPTNQLRAGDPSLDTDCAVCIDPYQIGDLVRTLPCRHSYHKSCIDPWLLEHRTCPMCKADILKYFGYQITSSSGEASRGDLQRDRRDSDTPEVPSAGSDNAFPFPLETTYNYQTTSPQLVRSSTENKTVAIVPLTVHQRPDDGDIEPGPSSSSNIYGSNTNNNRGERASSAGAVDVRRPNAVGTPNIVQVRARAQSCTRVVPILQHTRRPTLPTPVEASADVV